LNISKNGIKFIRLHEGVRNKAYLDPIGIPTIGVGFTMRSASFREWWAANKKGKFSILSTMTDAEIDSALEYLISKEYGRAVNIFLNKTVPQHVFDAAVSAVFNLGPGALKWKWAQAMKQGDYKKAADLLRVTGTTAGGKELAGLVRRRKEEALLMSKGVYTGVNTVQVNPPLIVNPTPSTPAPIVVKKSFLAVIIEMILNIFKKK
jgi:GH24 family phage-related lysozyme (muramidase)